MLVPSALLLVALPARAAPPGGYDAPSYVSYERPPTQRRGGFSFGVSAGYGVGVASAYPNEADKVGVPSFRESTGAAIDSRFAFWLGGALRDWLTVGVGVSLSAVQGNGLIGSNAGPLFHIEAFPLFFKGGQYQNLGLALDAGFGVGALIDPEVPEEILAGGGAASELGVTAFWEPFRFWAASTGPSITYSHGFGQTYSGHQFVLGWRFVIYGDQPRRAKGTAPAPENAAGAGWLGGQGPASGNL